MRVATRRLRADLRTFEPLVDEEWAEALVDELRWLGRLLGNVRDRDVQLAALSSDDADLGGALAPLRTAISNARDKARDELATGLAGSRYLDLLERMVQAARDPLLTEAADAPAADVVPDLLASRAEHMRRSMDELTDESEDEAYHAVRVDAKRMRYAAEAIGPFLSDHSGQAAKVAVAATAVQDLLGAHQDALVMEQQVRQTVEVHRKDPTFAFAAGRYIERLEGRRRALRADYPAARDELARRIKRWSGR
jgi:CHAD domain-containing protein